MQPSLFVLAHHEGVHRGRVAARRELRPTVRQLARLDVAVRATSPR